MYSFINITSPQQFSVLRFFGSGIDFYFNIKHVMKCGTLELFQKEKQLIPCLTLSVQALRETSKCRGGGLLCFQLSDAPIWRHTGDSQGSLITIEMYGM